MARTTAGAPGAPTAGPTGAGPDRATAPRPSGAAPVPGAPGNHRTTADLGVAQ